MSKRLIFFLLFILIVIGFIAFWYWRDAVFSKEILRLEILGKDSTKAGDEIIYTVKYKNNGNFVLENPKIIFELPENSLTEELKIRFTQDLKDIYPGQEESLQFKGRLLGKEGDLKVAHVWLSYTPHNLSARYESETTLVTKIDYVPITLTYDIPLKIEKGKEVSYSINYFSNIDYPLENLSLKVDSVKGLDFKSSDPVSLDNSEWKLDTLNKNQGGRITIRGTIMSDAQSHLNFTSKLGIWRDGVFVVLKEASQDVETIQTAKLELLQKVYHKTQYSIENSGPIPPKAGQSTTYVIKWQIKNYFRDVKNLKVKAVLPQNVSLEDNILPENQSSNFSFDSKSREIVWSAGNLSPDSSVELNFQIIFLPDLPQKGKLADLINQATVSGEDQSNGAIIQNSAPAVNTSLPDDQNNSGGGLVQ